MLKGIQLQMKLRKIFWVDVNIDALKGGKGCKQKGKIILFSRPQIAKATSGYYKC